MLMFNFKSQGLNSSYTNEYSMGQNNVVMIQKKSNSEDASIRSTKKTLKKLAQYKITKRETYEEVIKRLLNDNNLREGLVNGQ